MTQLDLIRLPEALAEYQDVPGARPLDADRLWSEQPDATWVAHSERRILARCSLWWTATPAHPVHRLGLIGHYAATSPESAHSLLEHAVAELASKGSTLAVGPMDGNTWRHYRLVTEPGDEPPFFLEPQNPIQWPADFLSASFTPLAHYFSSLNTDLARVDPRIARAESRMSDKGVCIRPLRLGEYEKELHGVYQVSIQSFQNNFLYSPLAETEFLRLYTSIRPYVRSELVLVAEHEGRTVGFVFCVPDHLQAARGQAVDTFIVKTVAILAGREWAGLGNILVARAHAAGIQLGYKRAIHALMHESNSSLNLSAHYTRVFRRYTLYSREISR